MQPVHFEVHDDTHQDFVIRHSVCSEAVAVKGDAVGSSGSVHRVNLSREQPVVDAPESRCGFDQQSK